MCGVSSEERDASASIGFGIESSLVLDVSRPTQIRPQRSGDKSVRIVERESIASNIFAQIRTVTYVLPRLIPTYIPGKFVDNDGPDFALHFGRDGR